MIRLLMDCPKNAAYMGTMVRITHNMGDYFTNNSIIGHVATT